METKLSPYFAGAVVFLASGAVLVLEVLGLRLVGPYVGVTLQTSSAVIGVALAAIAYGAWTGGWLADRREPRRLLAPLLLLSAIATAVTVPIVRLGGEWLRGTDPTNVLLLAMLALFAPAALLSTIPPLVVKLQLADLRETGRVVGRLSSVGTLGGITATLVTGFVLVAAFPTSTVVVGLAGLLALAAAMITVRSGMARSLAVRPKLMVLGLFASSVLAVATPTPCDVETAYHCARVAVDPGRPSGRTLWLNGSRQSYLDLSDPKHLEFAYAQWIGAYLDGMAPAGAPLDVLHLGGGGFTLPAYIAASRPGSRSLVLELDAGLVRLARAELGLRTGPDLVVRTGDARIGLAAEPTASRDLVIGDAFGHLVVPWHLTTRELVADVRRVLRPGGTYLLNLIDRPGARFARAEAATVASVFRYVAVIAPDPALRGAETSNFVIVGADRPLATVVNSDFWRGARVLTDDYAPVDQLVGSF